MPIYNSEKYLRDSIESILNQSYKNLEIILVNDGSTDSSGSIAKGYSDKDNRIVYSEIENSGPAEARNVGLRVAKGSIISFNDSDDIMPEDYIRRMYNKMQDYNADIVCSRLKIVYGDSGQSSDGLYEEIFYNGRDNILNAFIGDTHIHNYLPQKLYRKSILDGIYFPLCTYEDAPFTLRVLKSCKSLLYVGDIEYVYKMHSNSITTDVFSKRNMSILGTLKELENLSNDCSQENQDKLAYWCYYLAQGTYIKYVRSGCKDKEDGEELRGLTRLYRVNLPKSIKVSGKLNISYHLLMMSPSLFRFISNIVHYRYKGGLFYAVKVRK